MPLPLWRAKRDLNRRVSEKTPYKGMPDVAPNRLHISRHYGLRSTARPVRKMGDTCWQVSWLTARTLGSDLPNEPNAGPSVAFAE